MAIITLSRESFSGARELAQRVAETFSYRLVSREEIIEKTAAYGMSKERLERARRRRLGLVRRMDLEWIHYMVYTRATLTKEIRQGSLVYLGSNGRALLREYPNVLNVEVLADMEIRIKNLIKRTDYVLDQKKARRLIEEMDVRKARWQRYFHDEIWADSSEYDLTIEPRLMSSSEACDLIRSILDQPQYQSSHKSLETIDLLTVAAELRARIAMKPDVLDDNVSVELRDGVIVIAGSVNSMEDMDGIRELLD